MTKKLTPNQINCRKHYKMHLTTARKYAVKIEVLLKNQPENNGQDWARVGDAQRYEDHLKDVLDMIQGTGEYAL